MGELQIHRLPDPNPAKKKNTHTFLPCRGGGRLGRTRGELQIHRLPDPNPAKTTHFFRAEEGGGLAEHEGTCIFTDYQIPTRQNPHISSRQKKGKAWQNTRGTAGSQITRSQPGKKKTHISSKQRKGEAWENTRGAADSQI